METMRAIVLVTCIISLLSGMLDALKPNTRFDRQMRLLLSVVFLLGILTPLAKGMREFHPDWSGDATVSTALTAALNDKTEACAAANLEASLTELLREGGVTDAEVEVKMHTTEDNCIEIDCVTAYCTDREAADRLLVQTLGEEVKIDVEKFS